MPRLLAISDAGALAGESFAAWVHALLLAGVDGLQIRAREATDRELLEQVRAARAAAGDALRIVVNGRADVAVAGGADGVHLPADGAPTRAVRERFPALLVGRSTHSLAEVEAAAQDDAHYVVYGPVWATASKPDATPVGLAALRRAAAAGPPVLALGGADASRFAEARAHGAFGIAGIGGFHGERLARIAAIAAAGRSGTAPPRPAAPPERH